MAECYKDFSEESSEEFEDIGIELPDLEETQICQFENEMREVALYLSTANGKAKGPEHTPFELPPRWTYPTLKACIVNYIQRTTGKKVLIDQLYYKKAKGKALVLLNNDGDVPAMLNEYPLTYRSGKKKKSATLYMAVDFHEQSSITSPRRSPRIQASRTMDIFVYEITAEKKVLTTSNVLHQVNCDSSLQEIITLLKTYENEYIIYTPTAGLYWLRKGGKQPVSLSNEQDFEICKKEYKTQNIRLACRAVSLQKGSGAEENNTTNPRKRRLDMNSSSENEEWNNTHVQLVRDLEKRGTLWRFSSKHLTLWTDEIMNGNSGGINEEPDWEKHIESVIVPPKSRRHSSSPKEDKNKNDHGFQSTLEMMMVSDAKRNETLQSALMVLLAQTSKSMHMPSSSSVSQMPSSSSVSQMPKNREGKAMNQMTVGDCITFIQSIGLSKYQTAWEENSVDGPMLEAFIHPQLGKQLMTSMGITDEDCLCLVPEIYRLRARGYNNSTSTSC